MFVNFVTAKSSVVPLASARYYHCSFGIIGDLYFSKFDECCIWGKVLKNGTS